MTDLISHEQLRKHILLYIQKNFNTQKDAAIAFDVDSSTLNRIVCKPYYPIPKKLLEKIGFENANYYRKVK